ncbi:MAG: PEP-CTERM sorting domain-containing protein [Bryobacteraceae bacterium]
MSYRFFAASVILLPMCHGSYFAIPIGTLGGQSHASSINHSGVVGGYSATAAGNTHGFVWSNGVMTEIGTLGGGNSFLEALNETGQGAGISYTTGNATQEAFLLTTGGGLFGIGSLGGPESTANGLSDAFPGNGQSLLVSVVGTSRTVGGFFDFTRHAFLWTGLAAGGGGAMLDLGTLSGGNSGANAINNSGRIAGWSTVGSSDSAPSHAVYWENNFITDLGTLGGSHSVAYGINENGQIVGGAYNVTNTMHAFLWDGAMMDLGSLGGYSQAYDVNNAGQVVGDSSLVNGTIHGFVWEGGTMSDLNTLLLNPFGPGVYLMTATAINDAGYITAGTNDGRAFLLVPDAPGTPEPASLILTGGGLGVLIALRRRTRGGAREGRPRLRS